MMVLRCKRKGFVTIDAGATPYSKYIVKSNQNYKNTDIHVYKLLTEWEFMLYSRKGTVEKQLKNVTAIPEF